MNLAAEVLEQGVMSFSSLFHKASNLLGFGGQDRLQPPPLDGEIIYCKNNVCVHPPANLNRATEHHPGYLNIRSQDDEVVYGSSMVLSNCSYVVMVSGHFPPDISPHMYSTYSCTFATWAM